MTVDQDSVLRPDSVSVMPVLSNAMTATMLQFGIETGLLSALEQGPTTPQQMADATDGDERMATEWVRALCAAGLALHTEGAFRIHPDLVAELTPGPGFDASSGIALYAALSGSVPTAVAAYRAQGTASPAAYPAELNYAMDQMSSPWAMQLLPNGWIPQIPGMAQRLSHGGRVAEIGCGAGAALTATICAFPGTHGTGFELDERQAALARNRIGSAGLADRVRISTEDATTGLVGDYDLILALNVLHDAPDLVALVTAAGAALNVGGSLLVVESSDVAGPAAAMLLATSTLYCIPTTRHRGGHDQLGTLGLTADRLGLAAAQAGLNEPTALPSPVPLLSVHYIIKGDPA